MEFAGMILDSLRDAYLRYVAEARRTVYAPVDSRAAIPLDAVYTSLLTLPRSRERDGLSALERLDRHPRLLLFGKAGSGKTTFANFVARCLAGEALGRAGASLQKLTEHLPGRGGLAGKRRQTWELGEQLVLSEIAANPGALIVMVRRGITERADFGPRLSDCKPSDRILLSRALTDLMQSPLASSNLRLEAGQLAADIGVLPFDLDAWVTIPADRLDYPFKIGKYPVTNAQYQRFVHDGGYERDAGWFGEEAQREILEFEQNFAKGEWPSGGPRYGEASHLGRLTLPVTRVSWYEAEAYASWLTALLRRDGAISAEETVRLPRVAEWQQATAGVDGRKYPWEGEFDAGRTNTRESRLDQPSPVHMYPMGATPEGVFDLTGNVWEWMADKEGEGIFALAGGAYWNDFATVGAAAWRRNDGYFRPGDVGFRVVVVPISRA